MLNEHNCTRFCALRRSVIALDYQKLNPEQREGVLTTQGPLLLLAGAGSGKTTVLINRIANLIKYGQGSDSSEVPDWVTEEDLAFLEDYLQSPNEADRARAEMLCKLHPAAPWSIIAITFTNKAAGELKSRLEAMLGPEGQDVWAFTFHSACVRILRRDIDKLGYRTAFTIYDTDDSVRVLKEILKAQNVDDKMFPPRMVLSNISRAKDNMQLAADYLTESQKSGDARLIQIGKLYVDYEKRLREADALDFDDLILQTVRLLQSSQEARDYWQRKFRYVLVDEYQDTNHLQYLLAALLAGDRKNICVVGDDDQSIYRFRGATIENILDFESQYKGARVIRLEQNYRSTQNILEAANAVIRNNTGRKGKNLWTRQEGGDKVKVYTAMNENDEAQYVAAQVLAGISKGRDWKDFAVLYRMNAQSNQLEYAFKRNAIPYKVVGGTKFFDRAEVKDMLAYLCVINNPADDLRLRRIINTPARGIGNRTIEIATGIAQQLGLPLYEVVSHAEDYPMLQKSLPKLQAFVDIIEGLREKAETIELTDFYDEVMAATGYVAALEAKKTVENRTRVENVHELKSSIQGYLENAVDGTLEGFLDEVALYTDLDSVDEKENAVVIMTMHAAKGLEFPVVFVVGMEDGLFPGMRSIGDTEEMEEERRLCYVALTRAEETLYLSCARQRMLFGRTTSNNPSCFLEEIPEEYIEKSGRSLTEESREYGGHWKDNNQSENGERPRYAGRGGAGGRGSYSSRPRRPRRDDGKPLGGGISVSHAVAPTGQRAVQATFNLLSQFKKGDMVDHSAFGKGMIVSILPMGGDALVEVAFDGVGNKKLMLKAASQHMKKVEKL
ncbi:MAG: UvrD-helicase domain-containing protein [Clostridiales bacterium]|nr:UvrD-helicase domain-containing protein [Clostridiales bacterium]